jgi:hypothetical protein
VTTDHAPTSDRRVLVFDFDGVICDSWRECALVTWSAHYNRPPAEFSIAAFDALPTGFIERFRMLRGFARHLGHFLVSLLADSEQIRTQADFDRCYGALAPDTVKEFVTRASCYRETVRKGNRECWLTFHHMYEGMPNLLSELADHLYVVTARDSAAPSMGCGSPVCPEPAQARGSPCCARRWCSASRR